MRFIFSRLQSILLLVISMSFFVGAPSWAAQIDEEHAKLVSKFAKHVTWPENTIKDEFVIGVYRDVAKYEFFQNYFADKLVKGKEIDIRLVKTMSEAKTSNLLYITETEKSFLNIAYLQMKGSNILLVTEDSNERYKTMIDISFNKQNKTLVFRINDFNIKNTPLKVPDISVFLNDNSQEILASKSSVKAQPSESAEEIALKKKLKQQQVALNALNNELQSNKEQHNLTLEKETQRLSTLQLENEEKSNKLKDLEQKLKTQESQLRAQISKLKSQTDNAQVASDIHSVDEAEIEQKRQTIIDLEEQVKKQKTLADNTAKQLAALTKKKSTESSSDYQVLFFIFLIIAIVALVIAFLMWKKAQKASEQEPQPRVVPVVAEKSTLLPKRENQIIKSENFAALGYIATDITYAVGLTLSDLYADSVAAGDSKNANTLKPLVTLLENFNTIAADQDDTDTQSFNLINYMKNMMMLYNFEFEQSDIIYNYSGESELTIKSVPSYIALILLNLINNSLKHGFDNNGNGIINLNVKKSTNGSAVITYSDDGKGMNNETLKNVFKPFFTTQEAREYVGVGMTTTHELVTNKLQGDIKLESEEGKGTKVVITLPESI